MTDKQPEALRLANWLDTSANTRDKSAAAELRRLHEENKQLQEKCRTYIEIHDAVVKDSDKLRAALAQPEPEPVAIVQQEAYGRGQVFWAQPASTFQDGTPLYTAPPRREWVGLTEKDIVGCFDLMPPKFARAIEAKLKEKNI